MYSIAVNESGLHAGWQMSRGRSRRARCGPRRPRSFKFGSTKDVVVQQLGDSLLFLYWLWEFCPDSHFKTKVSTYIEPWIALSLYRLGYGPLSLKKTRRCPDSMSLQSPNRPHFLLGWLRSRRGYCMPRDNWNYI